MSEYRHGATVMLLVSDLSLAAAAAAACSRRALLRRSQHLLLRRHRVSGRSLWRTDPTTSCLQSPGSCSSQRRSASCEAPSSDCRRHWPWVRRCSRGCAQCAVSSTRSPRDGRWRCPTSRKVCRCPGRWPGSTALTDARHRRGRTLPATRTMRLEPCCTEASSGHGPVPCPGMRAAISGGRQPAERRPSGASAGWPLCG